MKNKLLSLVIPVFNESEVLPHTKRCLDRVLTKIEIPVEILFVDDGSDDETVSLLRHYAADDDRYHSIFLSRNCGHQIALTAGIDHARGDAVIVLDADLQDPPELIPKMLQKWAEGFHVVYATRINREGESAAKKITATLFYRLMRMISGVDLPMDTGDFRLMDRKVIDALKKMPERYRFMRGMIAWSGFRQCPIYFVRPPRAAGKTKYPWRRMFRFSLDAIFSFSVVPLRLIFYVGLIVTFFSCALSLRVLYQRLIEHSVIPGFSALLIMILFFGGINFLVLGILGEYLGRVYVEVKQRPLYFIEDIASKVISKSNV